MDRAQTRRASRLAMAVGALSIVAVASTPSVGEEAGLRPLGPPGAPAAAFPTPARPVAGIVSPTWGQEGDRDAAHEVDQIAARLALRPGMSVADIGAGAGYDTLRLAKILGPRGRVYGEDVTPTYLVALRDHAKSLGRGTVAVALGEPQDPRLAPASIDAAIMVHMYHEITQPYALLYNLAPAFRPGGRLGVEELDRPTAYHGTPPALLTCELAAVGYRRVSLAPLKGNLGYFAVFAAPSLAQRPAPAAIRPCRVPPSG